MITLKKNVLIWMMTLLSIHLGAQEQDEAPIPCSTPTRESYFEQNPNARQEAEKLERITRNFIQQKRSATKNGITQNKAGGPYVIPIVFHVFGTDFVGKTVDDALVKDALKKSNEDFHGQNNDFNDVSNLFKPLRETMDIEFRLAEIDPHGNPTTGINYYNVRSGFGRDNDKDDEIREFAWDNYKYMNVYILLDLKNDKLNRSGVAWYPNKTDSDNNVARVVFNGRYLGTNSDENFRRILTHEFGHYLNLIHTFEGGCSGSGDQVDDTPATAVNSSGNCVVTAETCPGAGIPNSENFMDYTECYRMFTRGQVTRMEAAMQHETRFPLWQTSNHSTVFAQSASEPKMYYDFTTFSEGFENNGTIAGGREVAIRLVDGPNFSSIGTLSNTAYAVENLPAGLNLQVITTSNTTAVVRLTGAATANSKSNSIRNLKLTFNNAAFSNYAAADIKGYSKPDLRIEFQDPYKSKYYTTDRLVQVGVDGDNFESFGIIPGQSRPRYELSIDEERLMIGFDAGVKNVAVTSNSEVAFLTEGTTVGPDLNWNHNNRDQVLLSASYQAWKGKRGFVGLRIERAEFPGKYYYGWARLEASADGKLLRFIDFYSHEHPNVTVVAGQTDSSFITLSKPTFFEDRANDGKISETVDVILEGSASFTSQNLVNGIHYTISNLPEGLTASIQKTNNQLAKLILNGTATQHVKGDGALVKLNFLDAAFGTVPENKQAFDVQVRFFDPYKITYIDTEGLIPWINAQNTNQWIHVDTDYDFGDNFSYSLTYYDNKSQVVLNARGKGFTMDPTTYYPISLQSGTQVNASSAFASTSWGINRAPIFAGPGVPWNGTTGYTGMRFRDRAGRLHYGWVKMEANTSGTGARILAVAYNTEPDAGITVGQTVNDPCYAGGIYADKVDQYSTSIETFKFEHFSQKSDFPQNYTDFTSREIKVRPGVNNFTAEAGGNLTSSTNILGMWIDLNNDKDFEDSGEQLYMSTPFGDGTDVSGQVTLPNVTGTYTLRVTVKNETESDQNQPSPCDFFLHGEVEDYTINISNTNPVHPVADFEMPSSISAKGLATITDKSLKEPDTWSWEFEGGSPATFNGQQPPAVYYENTGTFQVSLTVTKGAISNTLTKTLTVDPHPDAYCEVSRRHTYPRRGDITKVVLGDINNSTATGSTTGYSDFKSMSTTMKDGQTYPFEITTNKHIISHNGERGTNLIIWIDWNRNNEFTLDEIAYERRSIAADSDIMVLTGNITVPTIRSEGATVMRVIRYYAFGTDDRPVCGEISEADAEDYTINLQGNVIQPPVANFEANTMSVQEGGSISFTDLSTKNPTSWSWSFIGGSPAISANQNPTITYNTPGTYEVTLTATNAGGSHSETKTGYITVTEASNIVYCESSGNRVRYEWIAGVEIGIFSNTSGAQKYSDFTAQTATMVRGESNAIALTPGYSGSAYDEYFRVWIDYNKDGDFSDAGELAFDAGSLSDTTVNGTITPEVSVPLGTTRMRVSMKYKTAPDACGNIGDGEVEDYSVTITDSAQASILERDSAKERENNNISMYPNPAKEKLTISFPDKESVNSIITLHDFTGKIIGKLQGEKSNTAIQFNIENLRSGTYIVRISTNNTVDYKMFVKE